jgi:hypothetical protein
MPITAQKMANSPGEFMSTVFKPVSAANDDAGGNGIIKVLRSGKLITLNGGAKSEEELASGTTVTGTFAGSQPNKFNPERSDYRIRESDGTLVILAQTASLSQQLSKVSEGDLVQIVYNGRKNITRKNGAKASMHDFKVLKASDAE